MDFNQMERALRGKKGDLGAVMESPEGKRLAEQIDSTALQEAVKRGDTAAMQKMLAQILSTPEGRALAARVQKAVGNK